MQELDHFMIAEEIRSLWLEYEQGPSLEAAIARQLDKFEMILQANEYEIAQPEKVLDSFFESTLNSFVHPEVGDRVICIRYVRYDMYMCCLCMCEREMIVAMHEL